MIDWSARAAAHFHENAHTPHRQNPRNKVSEVSAVGGGAVLPKNTAPTIEPANDPADAYGRWLLHFADRDDLAVTFSPPVTRDEALHQYPDALAANHVPDLPPPLRGCSNCRHSIRFDNCGLPVETGLAETFQLANHPTGGAGCEAFEVRLIAAEHRVAALLEAGLLDTDDADLVRKRYDDAPTEWGQLLDGIARDGLEA